MKIEALIFDIDGTVYSNNLMYLHTVPLFLRHPRTMLAFSKARKKLHYDTAHIDSSGLSFAQYQYNLLGRLRGISSEQAQHKLDNFRNQWETIFNFIKPYKQFKPMVEHFKAKGLKLALLSDFPLGKKMERLKLDGIWDAALCTEDTGALKPDVRGFLAVAQAIGVNPANCLYVGNSYKFDVIGASKAGMLTAHLKWGKAKKGSLAGFTFYNYDNLKSFIESKI